MSRVSVIMPVYNAERYVEAALNSILNQSFNDIEVFVVDDGSKDNSYELLINIAQKDNRVKVFRNEKNKGVAYTRNRLLRLAESEYIAILDADDVASENRLSLQVDYLEANPDVTACFGNCRLIDEYGEYIGIGGRRGYNDREVRAEMIFHNILVNSTAMFRRCFVASNSINYKDGMCGVEDYLFWTECLGMGARCVVIKDILCDYRIVETGLTIDNVRNNVKKRKISEYIIADEILKNNHIHLSKLSKDVFRFWVWSGGGFWQRRWYTFWIPYMVRELKAYYRDSDSKEYIAAIDFFVKSHT